MPSLLPASARCSTHAKPAVLQGLFRAAAMLILAGLLMPLSHADDQGPDREPSETFLTPPERFSFHFTLSTAQSPRSQRLESEVIQALEKWYGRFLILFEAEPETPMQVVLYPTQVFHASTGAPPWADGVWEQDGIIRVAVGGLTRVTPPLERVLAHELAHAFIWKRSRGQAPRWLQEGLAQLATGATSRPLVRQPAQDPDGLDYRASLDFASTMSDAHGIGSLIDVLHNLARGLDVDEAFRIVTGRRCREQFRLWRNRRIAQLEGHQP